jgi:hypothetical protein
MSDIGTASTTAAPISRRRRLTADIMVPLIKGKGGLMRIPSVRLRLQKVIRAGISRRLATDGSRG